MTGTVDVITASAGTGKTYRLVQEVLAALDEGIEPERLMAVTFTNRAAAELVERIRTRLLADGRRIEAERLLGARIGTVHAVFGDMLREFAFEAGRSPHVEILGEDTARRMFSAAADAAISAHAAMLQPLAVRFGFAAGRSKIDWRDMVRNLAAKARSNGISPARLAESARRSWESLARLLPASDPAGGGALDAALAGAVGAALAALRDSGDKTGVTASAVETLEAAARVLGRRPAELSWQEWAQLTKLKPAVKSMPFCAPVIEAASAHVRHPRLRDDLQVFITEIFACAEKAGVDYGSWKAARGVVDFDDQEATSLELLGDASVCAALRERVGRVLVDEFQDTSPIQMALFMRMSDVAGRSVWVGDPKQSIYGFRGTEPDLVAAVADRIPEATGGVRTSLDVSRRSRAGLVRFFDALFVPGFARMDMPAEQVALGSASRPDIDGQPAALGVMPLAGKNEKEESLRIAEGVLALLADAGAWPVAPRGEAQGRPLRPGDIAVLCRRNDRCALVADALEAVGLRSAIGRPGLMRSSEVVVALSALRWVVDRTDRTALAELAHLTEPGREGWLEAALSAERADLETLVPAAAPLAALRARLLHLSPSEALDAALVAADVVRHAGALGDAEARLANLEALRGLARDYEDECAALEKPATASGLVGWLVAADAERPPNPDPNAVQVLTCHQAKGLEWPLVILSDLGEPASARVFNQCVAEQEGSRSTEEPLAGRWLRLWPWPYGPQKENVGLDAAAAASPEGIAAEQRAREESVRVLYVAMTRARDYLVLAPRTAKAGYNIAWLNRVTDGTNLPLLSLPSAEGAPISVGGSSFEARFVQPATDNSAPPADGQTFLAPQQAPPGIVHPPLVLRPSDLAAGAGEVGFDVIALGPRLRLIGDPDMESLGEALHTFLAADRQAVDMAKRLEIAASCMRAWGVIGALAPEDFAEASDRLRRWHASAWPEAEVEHEVPIAGRAGDQRVSGRIDMLVRSAQGVCIVDHKTFPGGREAWPARMAGYGAQLRAYAEVCQAAGEAVAGMCIHLPIAGVVLRLV